MKRGVCMEMSKAGTKEKRSPNGISLPNQNTIITAVFKYLNNLYKQIVFISIC